MNRIKVNDKGVLELTTEIAEAIYDVLHEYPSEERWQSGSKLHNSAIDLLFHVSVATADTENTLNQTDWRYALKYAQALETIYIFAGKQGFYKIDPEVVVKIQELREILKVELKKAQRSSEATDAKDMKKWLEKYTMWKEMQS